MKIRNRNIGIASMWASRFSVLLLTGVFIVISCSEDSVAPEPPSEPDNPVPMMCISYYDALNQDLKFNVKSGDSWGEPELASVTYDVGRWPSLGLDDDGNPHISYYEATHGNLKYVTKCGGCGWYAEPIDYVGSDGAYTSLAIDPSGNPHFSYYDGTNGNLKHATKKSGSWIIEIVDNAGSVGAHTSLALDARGNPSISYYDNSNGDLKLASKTDGFWVIETVDSDGDVGWYTSLALDTFGNPHIAYCESSDEAVGSHTVLMSTLKYAVRKNGIWERVLVDREDGRFPTLALDAQGNPHISYYEYHASSSCYPLLFPFIGYTFCYTVSGTPKYAMGIDGFWIIEAIDDSFSIENECFSLPDCPKSYLNTTTSVAFDDEGNLFVSYYDHTNRNLKCAMRVGGSWVIDTVDNAADVGSFSSLAFGPYRGERKQ